MPQIDTHARHNRHTPGVRDTPQSGSDFTAVKTNRRATWTKADAWYRRDVGDGSYLIVSWGRIRNGTDSWQWRRHETRDGTRLALSGQAWPDPTLAQADADQHTLPRPRRGLRLAGRAA